ncbi:MAG: FtsX-like permease family protein [Planctomycetes bacterium]|nr:FtsX-like permease family protein [Planctomycetota bacterium]
MSTALVAAIACAMASLDAAVRQQLDASIGTAQIRVQPAGGNTMDAGVLGTVRSWPGVRTAEARLDTTLSMGIQYPTFAEQPDGDWVARPATYRVSAFVSGVDLDAEFTARPPRLVAGRLPAGPNELLIDASMVRRLSFVDAERTRQGLPVDVFADPVAYLGRPGPEEGRTVTDAREARRLNEGVGVRVGDELTVLRLFGPRATLTVVGIAEAPPLGGKPMGIVDLSTLERIANRPGRLSQIEIELESGVDPEAFAREHAGSLGAGVLIQTTERITSGVEKNLAASQLGLIVVGAIALLCASFIIMTGLTTGVAEQQRTLAVLRCIGAERLQLGVAQLMAGAVVGALGAVFGVPLGVAMTWTLSRVFERQLPEGLVVPPVMLTLVVVGSLLAGLFGALWPAWRAASLSPLGALSSRAVPPSAAGLLKVLAVSLVLIAVMIVIARGIEDSQTFFWSYVSVGIPAMFIGYFLLSVPVVVAVAWLVGPALGRILRLPPALLTRTVRATPYRHGFTAGALMTGLALMVAIWTNGGAALRDWLSQIRFPDAFAYGLPLGDEAQPAIDALPFVRRTTAITIAQVDIDGFGVEGLQQYKTNFFGLDYDIISDMFQVEFIEGDPETAARRMDQGGAVLVAREFTTARGIGVGDEFVCSDDGVEHRFEIAGVVTSAGLEFISQYFDFGGSFVHQTIHSVVGSRKDVAERFGVTRPYIIGIELDPEADETAAVAEIREATVGMGVLNVGSGREIREQLEAVFKSTLAVFSTVAIGAMLVACFGVANLIIAEVESRRYELGVIRSVGGSRRQMVMLVCGQAVLIGLAAGVLGTLLGIQAAWGGQVSNRKLIGIDLTVRPPIGPIALGWVVAVGMAVLAAVPTAWRIALASPRALLASRG